MYNIQEESIISCREELDTISKINWEETANYNTGFIGADWGLLEKLEEIDSTKFYTVRDGDKIIGYALFIVNPMINREGYLVANNNVIFVLKEYRNEGIGDSLLKYIEDDLRKMGVYIVGIPLKKESPLMERNGYMLDEYNYTKRIG